MPTDIFPTLSRSPRDGGVRALRDETPPKSVGGRKGFSSVLRSVRGEVGKTAPREAEGARPVSKADDGPYAKDTKGLHGSTQQERASASSQTSERPRSDNSEDEPAGETRTGPESGPRHSVVESKPQDQGAIPISGLLFVSDQPRVVDETAIRTEAEPRTLSDEASLDTSSEHPLILHEAIGSFATTSETLGGRSSLSRVGAASDLSSTQQVQAADLQANDDGMETPGGEQGSQHFVKDNGRIVAGLGGPTSIQKDVVPATSFDPQNPGMAQVGQDSVQKTSLEGNVFVAKAETVKHDGEPVDHSVSSQGARQVQAGGDHHALGAGMEQSFSHGRQLGSEGSAQFGELWSGHNGQQNDTGELKIPQPFVVDHTIANESVAEPTAPGSSRQASPHPGTPAQTSPSTHMQPGLRAEDAAQSTGASAMRSVVVNVAQPDLGHVNIRVAMNNDVVHTHFSSDRLEVGQFFLNSQDRLQAALQASGLDMGQFRVDIDRQNGGRSFQQGPSQEQSWNQASHGMGQEPHDQQDQSRGTLQGLLNVVA